MIRTRFTLAAAALLAGPAAAQVTLAELYGSEIHGNFGHAVAPAGDIDKDGTADLLVGEPGLDAGGLQAGAARILSGKSLVQLRAHYGSAAGQELGTAVAGGVDVNKDGWPDYLLGAPAEDVAGKVDNGSVRLHSGKTGAVLMSFWGSSSYDRLGTGVAFLGDLNGDGWQDFGAFARFGEDSQGSDTGIVRVWSGANGGQLLLLAPGPSSMSYGDAFAPAGDWNGDGTPDIAIGDPQNHFAKEEAGLIEVRSGSNGASLFKLYGESSFMQLGTAVANVGDVDGDGKDELLVGADWDADVGSARLLRGGDGVELLRVYGSASNDLLGRSVARTGDVDRDGRPDLLVGANGYARIVSGTTGALLWQSIAGPPQFGGAVASLGDGDGDGWIELAVGGGYVASPAAAGAGLVRLVKAVVEQEDLGSGGPGAAVLEVLGTPLASGGTADLHLTGAPALQPAFLLASAQQAAQPFKGGVLVPKLAGALTVPLATDAAGAIHAPGLPGGSGPVDLYVQVLVKAPALPQGVAISNALRLEFLP